MALSAKDKAAVKKAGEAGGLKNVSVSSSGKVSSSNGASSSGTNSIAPSIIPSSSSGSAPSGMTAVKLGNGDTVYVDSQGGFHDANGGAVSSSAVSGAKSGSASILNQTPLVDPALTVTPTGDPALDAILKQIADVGNNVINSGYTIPKTLQITPGLVSQFLDFAHGNVDPYYQQLMSGKIADVKANLTNLGTQFGNNLAGLVQNFGTDLATEQNSAGAYGTAFSGQRALTENNMVAKTNRDINSLASQTAYDIGGAARAAAADVGSANAGAFSLPTLNTSGVSKLGGQRGGVTGGNSLDFGYDPSIYKVGNIPSAQDAAAKSLQQTYLSQYGTLAGAQSNSGRSVNDLFGMMGLKK